MKRTIWSLISVGMYSEESVKARAGFARASGQNPFPASDSFHEPVQVRRVRAVKND